MHQPDHKVKATCDYCTKTFELDLSKEQRWQVGTKIFCTPTCMRKFYVPKDKGTPLGYYNGRLVRR